MKLGNWMFWRPNERRVLLMGLDYAGKTTLLYRWLLNKTVEAIPTVGFNVETIKYPAGYAFEVWDVGGCDKIRPLYRHYFQNTELIIFLHNCADMDRFDEQLDLLRNFIPDEELRHVPVLVVLTVQDLMEPATKDEDMAKIMAAYQDMAVSCRRPAPLRIFNSPGFSATTTENPNIILDELVKMITDEHGGSSFSPKTNKSSDSKVSGAATGGSDAERAKAMADTDVTTTDDFWRTFEDGTLEPWDHYHHLKAGFFVLVEAFEQGGGVLDAAETFIRHLERLRAGNPQRFRNTTHRTMTIFWLAQLHVAASSYIHSSDIKRALRRDDFKAVVLNSPQLTDGRLWSEYYSKGALFNQEAKDCWCLPDLRPLPSVAAGKRQKAGHAPTATVADADRLIGFGLTVVQQTMSSKARRGPIVKAALDALMSSTMRERTVTTAIPPYSETQAYFWVQLVHAAIATATTPGANKTASLQWSGSVESLTLPALKALFGITGDEWREHYSAKLWESLGARMQFQPPDKKPLPNVIAVSDHTRVGAARGAMARSYAAEDEPRSELPPPKDLAVMAAVLAQELADGSGSDHGRMIQALFRTLQPSVEDRGQDPRGHRKRRSLAIAEGLELPCPGIIDGSTQRMFWVQQVLLAVESFEGADFGDFIRSNVHLAYKDLPLVHYSPMLWASQEAKAVYLGPDRKSLSSFII
ncbi:ARF-like GTPase ARLP2 [Cordyceps javanica]|uniref:ADP-ribosylation factor n=1 Tax=Cordyceps javanica TaxID=43265 RepID=A0A545UP37_9HYPO|nr:ARF-like GTPase ARLP2 [Cordyceps javanica]